MSCYLHLVEGNLTWTMRERRILLKMLVKREEKRYFIHRRIRTDPRKSTAARHFRNLYISLICWRNSKDVHVTEKFYTFCKRMKKKKTLNIEHVLNRLDNSTNFASKALWKAFNYFQHNMKHRMRTTIEKNFWLKRMKCLKTRRKNIIIKRIEILHELFLDIRLLPFFPLVSMKWTVNKLHSHIIESKTITLMCVCKNLYQKISTN